MLEEILNTRIMVKGAMKKAKHDKVSGIKMNENWIKRKVEVYHGHVIRAIRLD